MPKGYSKEIMEALFREEEKKQKQAAVQDAARKEKQKQQMEAFKQEMARMQSENMQAQFDALNRKINRTRILAWIAVVLALIAAAAALQESMQDLMILLP